MHIYIGPTKVPGRNDLFLVLRYSQPTIIHNTFHDIYSQQRRQNIFHFFRYRSIGLPHPFGYDLFV
ncbi:MAG: hypothetical protein LBF34_01035 [Puniceicoccales bacterium]|nr:hypothetical protein [Puniceicoccales bacterium]